MLAEKRALDFDFPHACIAPLPIVECVAQRRGEAEALASGAGGAHGQFDAYLVDDDDAICMI